MSKLLIATRSSPLAIHQAEWVQQRLLQLAAERGRNDEISLVRVKSEDYQHKDSFVKPGQEKVLEQQADIVVHSAKDLPVVTRPGLTLAAICERADAADVLVGKSPWSELPAGARVATTSLRRKTHLLAMRPDLHVTDLRGNIGTRLEALNKADEQGPVALVLAAAGLIRLGYEDYIQHKFMADEMLPAAGQGSYAIECRLEDKEVIEFVGQLNHPTSAICIRTERLFCRLMGADCYGPVGAYADLTGDSMRLRTMVGNAENGDMLRCEKSFQLSSAELALLADPALRDLSLFSGITAKAETLAKESANHLFAAGAEKFLGE